MQYKKRSFIYAAQFLVATSLLVVLTSQTGKHPQKSINDAYSQTANIFLSGPVLSPAESIAKMRVEAGFEVKAVAAEPMINVPVALSFDDRGRLWVVEMPSYMPDTIGTGEDKPTGKIKILEDTNQDGVMDKAKVFMDSLVLPRAICLIEDGILVAETPNLYFVQIKNDLPGKKILVADKYTEGGNVEHEPNGLYRALDNWIYNAKSSKRYRKKGQKWLIEKTHFRGQWGISQDNYGRLYYNHNSLNLQGDYFAPGLGVTNPNQRRVAGFSQTIVGNNRVYPSRPTPGVNRGYQDGILDDSLQLVNFTAACSPLVYRGGAFKKEYESNVFVAEPAANLIKRNILQNNGYIVKGEQAYKEKEFLTSQDERFRPVSLYNGPDGAMYVVDMYRGIIQHKAFLTPYLKKEIAKRELTNPLTCGRIYKILPQNKQLRSVTMPQKPQELVKLLQHANGWVRDKAQQRLIDNKSVQVVPALRKYLSQTQNSLTVIHALWTLEGLDALQPTDVKPLLQHPDWSIRMQALAVLPSVMQKETYVQYVPALEKLVQQKDALAAPYVAFLVHYIQPYSLEVANRLLKAVAAQFPDDIYVADAVISNLHNEEADFMREISASNTGKAFAIQQQLKKVLTDIEKSKQTGNAEKEFAKGAALFKSTCQPCHGADGNGIASLAPPLNNSEWVIGNKDKLIPIVLFGLSGPVKVNGKVYKAPEISGDMPGIGQNNDLSDEDIAQLLSYIRNAWNNKASRITPEDVGNTRLKYKGRQKSFTIEQLAEI